MSFVIVDDISESIPSEDYEQNFWPSVYLLTVTSDLHVNGGGEHREKTIYIVFKMYANCIQSGWAGNLYNYKKKGFLPFARELPSCAACTLCSVASLGCCGGWSSARARALGFALGLFDIISPSHWFIKARNISTSLFFIFTFICKEKFWIQ